MSKIYQQAITNQHLTIFNELADIQDLTLVGGTALALQVGHRKSYDLDFATNQNIKKLQKNIHKKFQNHQLKQRLLNENQYTLLIDQISVTFFHDQALLHSPFKWNFVKLASIKDIFSSKLFVIGKRATWRDYVDIAFLLKSKKISLAQGIQDSIERYQVSQKWILEPLGYFQDITMTPIDWLNKEMSSQEVKTVIKKAAKKYLTKVVN